MKLQNDSGYILVTVLIVVLLLSILGGSYAYVMINETNQSARHNDSVQAYYYARSGVEAATEWLFDNEEPRSDYDSFVDNDNNTINLFGFDNVASFLHTDPFEGYSAEITITIYEDINDNPESISLSSTGHYHDQKFTVIREFVEGINEEILLDLPEGNENVDYACGISEEWSNDGGNLNNGNYTSSLPVVFKNIPGDKVIRTNGYSNFTAPEIYFDSEVIINNHGELDITAKTIVFYNQLSLGNNNATYCFHLYPNEDIGYIIFYDNVERGNNTLISVENGPSIYTFNKSICFPSGINEIDPYVGNGSWGDSNWY